MKSTTFYKNNTFFVTFLDY